MAARLTLAVVAALALAPVAAARVSSDLKTANVGAIRTVRIEVVNDRSVPLTVVGVQVPPTEIAELVSAGMGDPTWLGSQDGIFLEWQAREPLPPGGRAEVRLRFRFRTAGEASMIVRVAYADGSTERAPIGIQVVDPGDLTDDVVIVSVLGAAMLIGSVAVFVLGRRRLRA